jgi:hypothetical protein
MTYEPRKLSGRCSHGGERGKGTRWHAVSSDQVPWGRAFCGAKPGRLSGVGWQDEVGTEVTCSRCRTRLERSTTFIDYLLSAPTVEVEDELFARDPSVSTRPDPFED